MTLKLYTWATPNGQKVHITLEELGLAYELKPVNIFEGEQMQDAFKAITPNRRIPVLVDTDAPGGPLRIMESGAIMLYLADKHGQLIPQDTHGRWQAIQWLMWQMGGLGPMMGQAQHFFHYAMDKHPYAIARYTNEAGRLLAVMDAELAQREFLAGDYSIADIACFPWVRIHKLAGQSLDNFAHVRRWYGAIRTRPAVDRGMAVLREHLTGVPRTQEAHDIMFGSRQFGHLPPKAP
jgi:GST-like protein